MQKNLFLKRETARRLYRAAADLPIVDYHCHLSPREIYEDAPFSDIAQMWLSGDHYKWRLMRAAGVPERLVTGDGAPREKFLAYAGALAMAPGNPLYIWSHMELSMYFGIEDALTAENAGEIFDRANAYIREASLSPRRLMQKAKVELVATTDDPADTLEFHALLQADKSFPVRVVPSFRTDAALNLMNPQYLSYLSRLSEASGMEIHSLADLKAALLKRLDFFRQNGCRLSDVGIEAFPKRDEAESAEKAFLAVLSGEAITGAAYRNFLFELYTFLAPAYKAREITMQLHLNVCRNASRALFAAVGLDAGGDCVGDRIEQREIRALLDAMDAENGLPRTILYTLEPSMYMALATTAGSFPNVSLGAAWWYNDHKRGMEEQLHIYAETGVLGTFYGMLTDSRSFLSYARHDYFRRVLCELLGEMLEDGEYLSEADAITLLKRVCVENSRRLFE